MELKGQTAIVTGASDGMGKEIALALAGRGVNVAPVARNEAKLEEVARQIGKLGVKTGHYVCDIGDNEQVEKCGQQIFSDFGGVNILINNAGVWQKLNYLEDIPVEEIERVMRINLIGLIQMTRVVLPKLKEADEAAIINISSRSGVTAQPGQTIYCASKWGVRGLTEVLKVDLEKTNVRVAGVYPAGIATKILEKAGDKISTEEFSDPKDVAEIIVFMLSRPKNLWLHEVRIEY
jgi:NADP-dependent 3-hydroxy acid dehydrogenase YdfG